MAAIAPAYDLTAVTVTPWAARAPRLLATVRWHRVARDLCVIAGLLSFVACTIALRLSLYPQAALSSRSAVLVTLVLGSAGVGLLLAAHRLHDAETR